MIYWNSSGYFVANNKLCSVEIISSVESWKYDGVYLSFSNSLLSLLALSRPGRHLHRNQSFFSSAIGAMAADRRVGVAVDFSPCSKAALRWAVENLVKNGDHLIVVNVQKEGHYDAGVTQLWETTGSRMIHLFPHLFFFSRSLFTSPKN